MFSAVRILSPLLLLLAFAGSGWGGEVAGELTGKVRWEGETLLAGQVIVPNGSELTIAAGSTVRVAAAEHKLVVRGVLRVEGSAAAPVIFAAPAGWQGIELMETTTPSLFRHARFDGPEAAITSFAAAFSVHDCTFRNAGFGVRLMRESGPLVENSRFVGCTVGINNEMRSFPTIRGNHFEGSERAAVFASHNSRGTIEGNLFSGNRQGVALMQPYPDTVRGNRFVDNELGIYCNQTKSTPRIEGNHFEGNRVALVNFSFAYPAVVNNRFTGNELAIRNDQYGSPLLEHNLFENNGTALYNYRKSNPKVRKNRFVGNQLAMYCDYSSYPEVKRNNFRDNPVGVKLGIYQSADWEQRSGSRRLMLDESQARQSKNPLLAQAPTDFTDVVDVSANWWGGDTEALAAAGAGENLALFYDRNDLAEVVYEGFGPESYRLDRVGYAPWLDAPVADAGLLEER